jgi:hypothetical protein
MIFPLRHPEPVEGSVPSTESEHPLHYYWIMLQTRLGRSCSYLETFFENVSFAFGNYIGTGCVVGVPGRSMRDHPALLKRLEKHKGKRQSISLTISDCGYDYRTESGLRVVISRGSKGILFEGDKRIGRAEGPSTVWLRLEPKNTKFEDEQKRPRVVNYK